MKTGIAQKSGQILYLILLAVSVVLIIVFYVNNGNVNVDDPFSKQMADLGPILNYFIIWAYILVGLAIFFTVIFPLATMVSNPKSGLKTLASLAFLALLLFVGYQLADDTLMELPGYDGKDNIPERLRLTGMGIYMMYFMLGGALLAMAYSAITKAFK